GDPRRRGVPAHVVPPGVARRGGEPAGADERELEEHVVGQLREDGGRDQAAAAPDAPHRDEPLGDEHRADREPEGHEPERARRDPRGAATSPGQPDGPWSSERRASTGPEAHAPGRARRSRRRRGPGGRAARARASPRQGPTASGTLVLTALAVLTASAVSMSV